MESIEEMSHKKGMAYTSHIDKQFRLAEKRINQKIEYWYGRIAKNNEVSLSAAKEMLRADELEDFHLTVEEYIEKGKTLDFDNRWMQQLENASAKVHIRRLEALQLQMQQECEVLFGNMTDGLDKTLTDVYTSAYYNTAYEFMKGHGVGWAFNKLDTRMIEQAINTAWAYDKKTFKARCWTNKEKLVNELNTTLTQSIIRGESPQKAIEQISKRMKVSRYNAGRLIMTESCAISTMAQKGCYKELGVEKFEFVATLDSSTSDVCRSMDGHVFDMSDYKIGINVPPLHCFCRSCTVPYYEDDFGSVGERATRGDDGKTYHVSANMKYDEWYSKFVDKKDIEQYKDVTQEILNGKRGTGSVIKRNDITVEGVTYKVDGKNVKLEPSENEIRVAELIKNKLGRKVELLPRVNRPDGIKTPDYLIDGIRYDLKSMMNASKMNSVDNVIRKSKGQSNRFVIDVSNNKSLKVDDFLKMSKDIFSNVYRSFVEEIMIISNDEIVAILQRK